MRHRRPFLHRKEKSMDNGALHRPTVVVGGMTVPNLPDAPIKTEFHEGEKYSEIDTYRALMGTIFGRGEPLTAAKFNRALAHLRDGVEKGVI